MGYPGGRAGCAAHGQCASACGWRGVCVHRRLAAQAMKHLGPGAVGASRGFGKAVLHRFWGAILLGFQDLPSTTNVNCSAKQRARELESRALEHAWSPPCSRRRTSSGVEAETPKAKDVKMPGALGFRSNRDRFRPKLSCTRTRMVARLRWRGVGPQPKPSLLRVLSSEGSRVFTPSRWPSRRVLLFTEQLCRSWFFGASSPRLGTDVTIRSRRHWVREVMGRF